MRASSSALRVSAPVAARSPSSSALVAAPSSSSSAASAGSRANPAAYVLDLIAAAAWSLYSNLARRWAQPGSGGAVEVFIPLTGLLLLLVRLLRPESGAWTTKAAIEAAALGGITMMAYVLWDVAMREGDLPVVLACSYFTPLLSTLVSSAYLGVMPRSVLWLGCLLIVAGSLVSWRSVSAKVLALR